MINAKAQMANKKRIQDVDILSTLSNLVNLVNGQFQGQISFSTKKGRNKCNTSFSCNSDWIIHFLYNLFCDPTSFSMWKGQFHNHL